MKWHRENMGSRGYEYSGTSGDWTFQIFRERGRWTINAWHWDEAESLNYPVRMQTSCRTVQGAKLLCEMRIAETCQEYDDLQARHDAAEYPRSRRMT